ncbi:hypothetical protein DFP73DRAFT_587337 [Morchella snyderi]|nr:hypothetical protein DFP73DRAFT_587337 [Morchella snyderi]
MFQIDRFKKGISFPCDLDQLTTSVRRKSTNVYPAIAARYHTGTRILWSEDLTGPGAFLTTHEDTVPDPIVPRLLPGIPHPGLFLPHQSLPSSKSITVKSACGTLTIFPAQSECETFKAGSRPEAKSTKGPYFRISVPQFTNHMRSAVPHSVLLDLKRPFPTSSTIPQTSCTPSIPSSEKTVDAPSLDIPEPAPASEPLSKVIPVDEETGLSDGIEMLPISLNAYISAIATDSTQPRTIGIQDRGQSVVIAECSVETVSPPLLDGTSTTSLGPIKPIDLRKKISILDSRTVDSTKQKNGVGTPSLVNSCITSTPQCASKSTGEQKGADIDIPSVNEESIVPPIVVQIHKILSLDDLVKDEHLAWGSEKSTSKDDITIVQGTENHLPMKITTASSSEAPSTVEDSHIAIMAAELVPFKPINTALAKPQTLLPHLRPSPIVLPSPLEAQYVLPHLRPPQHLLLGRSTRKTPIYESEKLFFHKPNTATPVPSEDPLETPDLATFENISNKLPNHYGVTHGQISEPLPSTASDPTHKLTNLVIRRRTEMRKDSLATKQTSGSAYSLKTEKGLIELPVMYTFCDDKQCSFMQNCTPCEKSHAKPPKFYIPFKKPICSESARNGTCPAGDKSCQNGAHPCPFSIRFHKCHKRNCPLDHSIMISPVGKVYSILIGEPQEIPTINALKVYPGRKKHRANYNLDPPGFSTILGPRSDNDWSDFTRIRILPTLDEVISDRPIYLPHKSSVACPHDVFNVGFRHQREAVLGQVKLALSNLIHKVSLGEQFITGSNDVQEPIYRVYKNCTITHGFIEQCKIPVLNFGLWFVAPAKEQIHNETVLRNGHLLALLIQSDEDLSLVWLQATQDWSNKDEHGKISDIGRVNVKMFNESTQKEDLEKVLALHSKQGACVLVDFGGVLPATFIHVLSTIQRFESNKHSYFARNLFQKEIPEMMFHIPDYLQAREIDFSSLGYKSKTKFGSGRARLELLTALKTQFSQKSSFGIIFTMGQIHALINSFTSRLSFIQGPPGTGKSFISRSIIKMLAINRRAWNKDKTTPILLTAQTNHALDETITGYIKCGLKVARLGVTPGHAIPKPDHVAYKTHVLPRDVYDPIRRAYNQARWQSEASSKELECLIAFLKLSGDGHEADGFISWSSDKPQIEEASLIAGLKYTIPQGFQGSGLKIEELEICSQELPRKEEVDGSLDLWKFTPSERRDLICGWKHALDTTLNDDIESARASLQRSNREMEINLAKENAAKMIDFGIDVVACTSTRAASDMELLRHLKIEVAIVEEAGEIVESMVLPIFGSTLQQLIMIGDHKQLKPFCSTPELAGGYYKQDQSLFERLLSPSAGIPSSIPLALLDCQRRMRPEIAGLVRSLGLYKTLMDGDNVKCYPDVPGMGGKNLLWLDHKSNESFSGTSYYNIHEADMIAAYAAHLIESGEFGIRDIVILTPYREQISVINRSLQKQGAFGLVIPAEDMSCLVGRNAEYNPPLESELKDYTFVNVHISDAVQVTTIDNYQGQEADIILYSAVRSNNAGRLGFTDITNRACVTLSYPLHEGTSDGYSGLASPTLQPPQWSGTYDQISGRLEKVETTWELSLPLLRGTILWTHCKRSLVEHTPLLVDATENGCQTTDIDIFPLHISELSVETAIPTVASHEEFFLCASRYFLSNADWLENGLEDGKSSREGFLESLNLSHSGLEENKWKLAGRYRLLKDFQGVYKVGLKQAAIVETEFSSKGLVSRMENLKRELGVAMAADFNWILAEMMKRARPHNSAQLFASALRQVLQELFE